MNDRGPQAPQRLLPPAALLAIVGLLVLALILLFPGREYFSGLWEEGEASSSVSIGYLKNLLRADPEDRTLRLQLARQQLAAGRPEAAADTLAPLADADDPAAAWLGFEVAWQRLNRLPADAPERERRRAEAVSELRALPFAALPDAQLGIAAERWLALERPAEAAKLYERLAGRGHDGAHDAWLNAGEWWLAAGEPGRASRALEAAVGAAPDERARREAALAALQAARQSEEVDVLTVARRLVSALPSDPDLLDTAIDEARAQGELDIAMGWAERYARLRPDDRAAARRKAEIELAAGRLYEARETLRGLIAAHPDAAGLRERLARTEEWLGHPGQTLAHWEHLAREPGGERYDREVIRLGRALNDTAAVLAALNRMRARGRLDTPERQLLADMLERRGEPERAIAGLRDWVASGQAGIELWRRLARLQEQTGDLEGALTTWKRYADRHGRGVEETTERARLQGRLWRGDAALAVLQSLPPPDAEAHDYWRLLGEFAWRANRHEPARDAYTRLHRAERLDADGYRRLIIAAARTGRTDLALAAAEAGWRAHRDPAILITALQEIRQPARRRGLFALADEAGELFAGEGEYWQLYADFLYERGRFDAAYAAYRRALAIQPGNSWARAALLYLLAETGRDRPLRVYLARWRNAARTDQTLWRAYATGYIAIGEPGKALPWYRRAVEAEPRDYLLVLDYADALRGARRFDDAFRMQRYALTELRPQLLARLEARLPRDRAQRERDARVVNRLMPMLGAEANRAWMARVVGERDPRMLEGADVELLLSWHLSSRAPGYARYWHLQTRLRRLEPPVWQRLAVALEADDQPAIERLLREAGDGDEAGVGDRIAGLRRLDRRAEAQLLALDHVRPDLPWLAGIGMAPRAAAELYREMPQRAGLTVEAVEIGDVGALDTRGHATLSGQHWSLTAEAGTLRLDDGGTGADFGGLDDALYAGVDLSHRQRRGRTRITLRERLTDDADNLHLDLAQRYRLTRSTGIELFAEHDAAATETGLLYALGLRDRAGMRLDWSPTARDTLSFGAAFNDYATREDGSDLGDGYALEAVASRAFRRGATHEIQGRLMAMTVRNSPVSTLPADIAARLPAGAGATDLVPREFSFLGAGLRFARGEPGEAYPLVASPRYFLDLAFRHVRPDGDFAMTANAGVGIRLLGSDELSLSLGIDQSGTAAASRTTRAVFGYQYFFGR